MKSFLMLLFAVCIYVAPGCSSNDPTVVQPDTETRTYPQTEVGESMDDVQ
ncbi:MAG: hypothetical protein WBD31_14530 [Rubripirellula sp.]